MASVYVNILARVPGFARYIEPTAGHLRKVWGLIQVRNVLQLSFWAGCHQESGYVGIDPSAEMHCTGPRYHILGPGGGVWG